MPVDDDTRRAAILDRLKLIVRRSAIYPDERHDLAFALEALSLDPADADLEHPLANLYRALHLVSVGNGLVYLSLEHRQWLTQLLDDFGHLP